MLDVSAAQAIVLQHAMQLPDESVHLTAAHGRLLREDLFADRDFPPFDRVTMDGIALRYADWAAGIRQYPIDGVGAAGAPRLRLQKPRHCLEIMTGAVLPEGTDTVIRYEDTVIENGKARVMDVMINEGQNIHRQGVDRRSNELVVPAGTMLSAAEIGVAATLGKVHLRVAAMPKVLIVSSGDELVEVDEEPLAHQLRMSNSYRLNALFTDWGWRPDRWHLPDDLAVLRKRLAEALERYDLLVISGGVSAGKYDFLPQVLTELKVEQLFHRVAQRPGKPLWFGRHPNGTTVFGLPGNPVSGFLCTLRYIQPWWRAGLGLPPVLPSFARLEADVPFKPDLTYFIPVALTSRPDGMLSARPLAGHGSGDLANLVGADAFLELPRGRNEYPAGEAFAMWKYR